MDLSAFVIPLTGAAAVWILFIPFQLADLWMSRLDALGAIDYSASGGVPQERSRHLVWTLPLGGLIALGVGFGVDVAVRLFLDHARPADGIWLLLALGLIVTLGGFGIAYVLRSRRQRASYASLRRDLAGHQGDRLTPAHLAGFREELARIDSSQARASRGIDPALRHPTVAYLTGPGWPRLVPALLGAVVTVGLIPSFGVGGVWVFIAAAVFLALELLVTVAGARASLASKVAWHSVHQAQRAEVEALLEGFDHSLRKGAAGFGDRVTRALQILREQQQ